MRYDKSKALIVRRADNIPNESTNWLWKGRLALGKLSLLAGHPGVGKSQVLIDLTARVSAGMAWPDGSAMSHPGSVLILNAEDDPSDTIGPRLTAAGADKSRCLIVDVVRYNSNQERNLSLAADLALLEEKILETPDLRLITLDPITSYTGLIDTNNVSQVREALNPLVGLAKRHMVSILVVSHLNKRQEGPALQRVVGSVSFGAIVRTAFIVLKDDSEPDRRLFLSMKNNLAPDDCGLSFEIEDAALNDGIETSRIVWGAESIKMSADQKISGRSWDKTSKIEEAKEFLEEILAKGPMAHKDIKEQANFRRIADPTLNRAKKELGVQSIKVGETWLWCLSRISETSDIGC